jgi:excinuclease ABC subunit C
MNSQDVKKINIPDNPGVYFFKKDREILYIGKATSLKDRVKSYFSSDVIATRGPVILDMVFKADSIDFIKTDSVLEALILENNLIKKYQPKYNTKEKDNKSFNYVVITDEDFSRVLVERGRNLENENVNYEILKKFGPYPNGTQLKEALKIVRKIFPFRDKCTPIQGKPCFNRQIGLCPGVCDSSIEKKDYKKIIKNIVLFFEGKKEKILKNLEKEMKSLAKLQKFEGAVQIRKTIFALQHIQDISVIASEAWQSRKSEDGLLRSTRKDGQYEEEKAFRIEAYDVAHFSGVSNVGVMTVLENGVPNKNEYRKFKINNSKQNDIEALKEILERRLTHEEWKFPDLIVVDGGKAQINIARKVVEKLFGGDATKLGVVSVVKNERHRPSQILGDSNLARKYEQEILLANSEAHRFAIKYHRQSLAKKSLI